MITEGLKGRDFITLRDFTKEEIDTMLDVALQLKADNDHAPPPRRHPADAHAVHDVLQPIPAHPQQLRGRHLPAGRARATSCSPMPPACPPWKAKTRAMAQSASRMSPGCSPRMGDCIAIRILGDKVGWEYDKSLKIIKEFAKWSHVPVINMEDNIYHPCQGMADVMTLREMFGRDLRGRKLGVTWTWGSTPKKPIAPHHDFMYAASFYGADIVFARPPEMHIDPDIEAAIKANVEANGGSYSVSDKMEDACENADIVYAKNYVCPGPAASRYPKA